MTSTELKTPDEWLATPRYEGLIIMDPDGWDRSPDKWEASWGEKITRDEFDRRWCMSTCRIPRRLILEATQ